jgi:CheY-like chemotaxis protein
VPKDFLSVASHELRSPLNTILGFTDLLRETPLTEEQSHYVAALERGSIHLLALINDLLDLSKAEAHQIDYARVEFDVVDLAEDVAREGAVRAREKPLTVRCETAPGVPERVVGDPHHLRQVLTNLVQNAVKFTEQGEVVLRAATEPGEPGRMVFRVSDTGIGIPPEQAGSIFDPFVQADASIVRRFGGTGLGLTISKRLVEQMGGEISVESVVGKGTTFRVALRFDPAPARPAEPAALGAAEILVVHDDESERATLRQILIGWGATVDEIDQGPAAFERLQDPQAIERFGVILLAARMELVSGFAIVNALRDVPGLLSRIVLLLPATHRRDDVRHLGQLGVGASILAPVKRSELLDAVREVMQSNRNDERLEP